MRGLLIAALIVAAAAKSPKNHLLGKVEKRASLPVIASARFVATGATLKAATPDKKKDAFGYNNFRFAKVKSLAKAEATAKAKVAAKANMAPPPNGIVPSSPYEYMSPSGRGFQDANTPFYGHYAGTYGPMGGPPSVSRGYGSFPNTIDPRGFGSHSSFPHPWSMNYSTP